MSYSSSSVVQTLYVSLHSLTFINEPWSSMTFSLVHLFSVLEPLLTTVDCYHPPRTGLEMLLPISLLLISTSRIQCSLAV